MPDPPAESVGAQSKVETLAIVCMVCSSGLHSADQGSLSCQGALLYAGKQALRVKSTCQELYQF